MSLPAIPRAASAGHLQRNDRKQRKVVAPAERRGSLELSSRPASRARPGSRSRPATSSGVSSFEAKFMKRQKEKGMEAIGFDEAFDMAYKRAVKRLSAERRLAQGPISLNKNASQIYVSGLLGIGKDGKSAFVRSKEESLWAVDVLRKIGEKLTSEEADAGDKLRRRSSIKESFASFGDVVLAAQMARKEMMSDISPKTEQGGQSRRNSLRASLSPRASVSKLLKRINTEVDLSEEFELKEILNPPDPASMYSRFKVEDISSFPHSEQERIREAFYRFKTMGSSDIDVDNLEKVLSHLGYLKIDLAEIVNLCHKLTKFSTLDYEEYIRFIRAYTAYERAEVQRVFRDFDEDGSGSLDTEEIEQVMAMFNITPFRSTVLSAIAVVDEDSTGVVEFREFVHLLTLYMKTEGFQRDEVKDLYTVFYAYAVQTVATSQLREIPSSKLRAALMKMYGTQGADFAARIVSRVIRDMERKRREKAAKRALREGGRDSEEQGLKFREFLVVGRQLREAEIEEYGRIFQKAANLDGTLKPGDLGRLLQHFGYMPLRSDVEDLLARNEAQEDQVDFERFVQLVQDFIHTDGFSRQEMETFSEIFQRFAEAGEVDVLQVAAILRWLGHSIDLDMADSYFQAVNFDGGELMGFIPFVRLMRLHREDYVQRIRDVFEQHCSDELVIKQERLKKALTQLDRRASVSMISGCLQEMEDSSRLDFDDFMKVMFHMHKSQIAQMRKQAGFTEDQMAAYQEAFDKYDLDGNRKLTREELPPLLVNLNINMRTVEDQRHFLQMVEEARTSATRCGATVEEVGHPGSPGITWWTFVHLLRLLQTQQDEVAAKNKPAKHSFTEKELDELRNVFRTWCAFFLEDSQRLAKDFDEHIRVTGGVETMEDSELKLSFSTLELLLRQLGVPITATHMRQLKAKMVLDPQNGLPVDERAYLIDSPGFFRLLTWMLDANFAGIRERSEEVATEPMLDFW